MFSRLVMLHSMHSAWVLPHVWMLHATDPEEVKVPRQTNGDASGHHCAAVCKVRRVAVQASDEAVIV